MKLSEPLTQVLLQALFVRFCKASQAAAAATRTTAAIAATIIPTVTTTAGVTTATEAKELIVAAAAATDEEYQGNIRSMPQKGFESKNNKVRSSDPN